MLIRHRAGLAIFTLIVVGIVFPFALRIHFENSVESFLPLNDPKRDYYQEFKKEFGDDQLIALLIPTEDVFTKETLREIEVLSERIKDLPTVRKVQSITTAKDIMGTEGSFEVLPFLDKIPDSEEERLKLKHSAVNNPLYRIDLISLDGSIASVLIEPKHQVDPDRYRSLFEDLKEIISTSPLRDREYYLAGSPLVELQMTSDMWRDLGVFIPLTYVCLVVLLYLCFGNLQGVIVPLTVISFCMSISVGTIGLFGITMNAVTAGLPSLILCIAALDCIHLLSTYRRLIKQGTHADQAIEESVRLNIKPCLFTSLTTSLGFLSVAVTEVMPIRQFGLLAALSTLLCYPVCFCVAPYLLSIIPYKEASGVHRRLVSALEGGFFSGVKAAHRYPSVILCVAAILGVLSIVGVSLINVETNHLSFLRKDSKIRQATNYIEENLGGITPLEIIIQAEKDGEIKEPRVLRQIDAFQEFLVSLPEVDKTVSPVQFIKEMHQAMNNEDPNFYFIPDSRELIAQYLLTYSFSGRGQDLEDFLDYTYRFARVRTRLSIHGSADALRILEKIDHYVAEHFDPHLKVEATSHTVMETRMVSVLVFGQILGLGLAVILAIVMMAVLYRSVRIGVVSIVPNIVPILLTGGLMGFSGISLNAGTAMTACIALGVIIDDTIYFLYYARNAFSKERDSERAVAYILEHAGPAIFYTSIVLAVGFAILLLGLSKLTHYFGGLCAFAVICALLSDLLLLPAMFYRISWVREVFRNPSKQNTPG